MTPGDAIPSYFAGTRPSVDSGQAAWVGQFLAQVTSLAPDANGLYLYEFDEYTTDPGTGQLILAVPGRSATATPPVNRCVEINNFPVGVPRFVMMRFQSVVNGQPQFVFNSDAPIILTPPFPDPNPFPPGTIIYDINNYNFYVVTNVNNTTIYNFFPGPGAVAPISVVENVCPIYGDSSGYMTGIRVSYKTIFVYQGGLPTVPHCQDNPADCCASGSGSGSGGSGSGCCGGASQQPTAYGVNLSGFTCPVAGIPLPPCSLFGTLTPPYYDVALGGSCLSVFDGSVIHYAPTRFFQTPANPCVYEGNTTPPMPGGQLMSLSFTDIGGGMFQAFLADNVVLGTNFSYQANGSNPTSPLNLALGLNVACTGLPNNVLISPGPAGPTPGAGALQINGPLTLTQVSPCVFLSPVTPGVIQMRLTLAPITIGGSAFLTATLESVGGGTNGIPKILYSAYNALPSPVDLCTPLTLTRVTADCTASPATIQVSPLNCVPCSGSGGGGGTITIPCCLVPIPSTLNVAVSAKVGDATCLPNSFVVEWDAGTNQYLSTTTMEPCGAVLPGLFELSCNGAPPFNTWVNNLIATAPTMATTCAPFLLTLSGTLLVGTGSCIFTIME